MVYVLNQNGQPLMPTENHTKVRILLKQKKAKVIKKCPFTIQLLYSSTSYTQNITLGVDSGSKYIGLSATTKDKVLFESDVELRNDIVDLLSTRRQNRRTRRNRKTRYRKPRFNNRKRKDGWLPPSVQNKVDSHLLKESTKDLEAAKDELVFELSKCAQDILDKINDISEYCTIKDVDSLGIHYSSNYYYSEPDNNYLLKDIYINWIEDISDNNIYFESYSFNHDYDEKEYYTLCIPIKLFDEDYFNDTKKFSEIINKSRINKLENKIKEMQDEIDDLRSER